MALHDEEADRAWVDKWTIGGDWRVGLLTGLGDKEGSGLGQHVSLRVDKVRALLTEVSATTPRSPVLRFLDHLHSFASASFAVVVPRLSFDSRRLVPSILRLHPFHLLEHLCCLLAYQRA